MAMTRTLTMAGDTRWFRWINVALGTWLFLSGYLWLHSPASFTNTWLSGFSIAMVSLIAAYAPPVRWITTALAVWLFASALLIDHAIVATAWHNAILAMIVFVASLIPFTPRATSTMFRSARL